MTVAVTDLWLDFGTGASPVGAGATEVTPGDVWMDSNFAFGWQDGKTIESRDRGAPDDFLRDYNLYRKVAGTEGRNVTFFVMLDPGMMYDISLTSGSVANARGFSYTLEGGPSNVVSTAKGGFQTDAYLGVEVSPDGILEIAFTTGATSVGINELHIEAKLEGGAIHGYKFDDLNGNGVDDDEPRLEGVEIELYDDYGFLGSMLTGEDGSYWFMGLAPDMDYTVSEVVPVDAVQTAGGTTIIGLGSGEVVTAEDDSDLAFGNFYLGSIYGYKFDDLNGNGIDDAEPRLEGVEIILDDGVNEPFSVFTEEDGSYCFMGLGPGTYWVTEVSPPGYEQTTADPDPIVLTSGAVVTEEDDPGLAFGNRFIPEPTGPIWLDFGTAVSPVAAGHTQVTPADVFGANPAFGWEAGKTIEARDRVNPNDELRDYNLYRKTNGVGGNMVTFSVFVGAPGMYVVDLSAGSEANARKFSYSVEGESTTVVDVAAGAYHMESHVVTVGADGILDIKFTTGATSAAINELHIDSYFAEL